MTFVVLTILLKFVLLTFSPFII